MVAHEISLNAPLSVFDDGPPKLSIQRTSFQLVADACRRALNLRYI